MYDTHLNGWNRQHYQAGGSSRNSRARKTVAPRPANADTVGLVLKYCH
jgi:hypothetical protein